MLLSTEIVTKRAYHTSDTKITWAECELRKYLNSVFIEESFTGSDKMLIAESTVENADHPVYGTEGGSETADKVFLLSIDEVIKYFGDSGKIYGRADLKPGENWTAEDGVLDDEYNEDRMAEHTNGSRWYWLLRSPGYFDSHAAYVQADGIIFLYGMAVNVSECGIRPALWMEIG